MMRDMDEVISLVTLTISTVIVMITHSVIVMSTAKEEVAMCLHQHVVPNTV